MDLAAKAGRPGREGKPEQVNALAASASFLMGIHSVQALESPFFTMHEDGKERSGPEEQGTEPFLPVLPLAHSAQFPRGGAEAGGWHAA